MKSIAKLVRNCEAQGTVPNYRAIDYINLNNPFKVVTHSGNKDNEKRNPHKSYGYLFQSRLGAWLIDFLKGNLIYQ